MAATVLILAVGIFALSAVAAIVTIVSMGIIREERDFRLRKDTPTRLVGLILWSIFKDPKQTSAITRTPTGDLTVNRD
jgi:hypothetical protein